MVFGSDGVEIIEKRMYEQFAEQPDRREFTVNIRALQALINYYKMLTKLCKHEWDVTSPVDSVQLCRKCGLLERI